MKSIFWYDGFTVLLMFILMGGSADAKDPLGILVSKQSQISMDAIRHDKWNGLLKKYVDEDGYVAYSALKASAADRKLLRTYLDELSHASPDIAASKSAKIAFWINAYNAVTLEGILQEYPTTSIRNHTAKVFGYNIWKNLPLRVGGHNYSLEHIEHDILRKMNEPRIHFVIVCASVGCPRLLNAAYTPKLLEQQLVDNSKDFFARKKNFSIVSTKNRVYLSSILDWFSEDFGGSDQAVLKATKPYVSVQAGKQVENRQFKISYIDYDWSLNDQKTKKE